MTIKPREIKGNEAKSLMRECLANLKVKGNKVRNFRYKQSKLQRLGDFLFGWAGFGRKNRNVRVPSYPVVAGHVFLNQILEELHELVIGEKIDGHAWASPKGKRLTHNAGKFGDLIVIFTKDTNDYKKIVMDMPYYSTEFLVSNLKKIILQPSQGPGDAPHMVWNLSEEE